MASKVKECTEDNMEQEDEEDEIDEDEEEGEEIEKKDIIPEGTPKTSKEKPKGKRTGRTVLSGRGVTLKMLVDDGILNVEESCMSIDYLGQKFVADLLPNGKIKWEGSNKLFNSPSAWAIHCKKLVNPSKKSGCGWASVKYKGKKLDQFKATWFRKQRPLFQSKKSPSSNTSTKKTRSPSPVSSTPSFIPTSVVSPPLLSVSASTNSPASQDLLTPTSKVHTTPSPLSSHEPKPKATKQSKSTPNPTSFTKIVHQTSLKKELSQKLKNKVQRQSKKERSQQGQRKSSEQAPPPLKSQSKHQESNGQSDLADLSKFTSPRKTKLVSWPNKTSIKVSELRPDSDPLTLVECLTFSGQKKNQPFTVSINTNTLMLMDLHCHLTTSEVVGYLGGHWQRDNHHLQVVQAFPVKCRFADQKNAGIVEEEIRVSMKLRGLEVVGWYHSHPTYQSDPSARDIAAQQHYQKCVKVEKPAYEPCVGFIVSPYNPHVSSRESVVKAFWVQSVESVGTQAISGYPSPMAIDYTIQQSGLLTDDLLTEMRQICFYYKGSPDAVEFTEFWLSGVTFLDKVKASLMKKFPKDQSNRLICFINMLLS